MALDYLSYHGLTTYDSELKEYIQKETTNHGSLSLLGYLIILIYLVSYSNSFHSGQKSEILGSSAHQLSKSF